MEVEERKDLEYQRIKKLSEYDLDYSKLQQEFQNFVELAAEIAGTRLSLVNLIDNYTQWTVSSNASEFSQVNREESVCNHTIRNKGYMEISRLDKDERFHEKDFVKGDEGLKYYLGIPLTVGTGENIGALCVIDQQERKISDHQKKLLQNIAREIVEKLERKKNIDSLQDRLARAVRQRNQIAHDVRGPLAGIAGLVEHSQSETLSEEEFREYFEMIGNSASGLLELTDEVLERQKEFLATGQIGLSQLKKRLEDLYLLPAQEKEIDLYFEIDQPKSELKFSKKKLLPIAGNIIANSIKFTSPKGRILVKLGIKQEEQTRFLNIQVKDNGIGISKEKLQNMEALVVNGSLGTRGEKSYGFGLQLVREMVESLAGELQIDSAPNQGTCVNIMIPV